MQDAILPAEDFLKNPFTRILLTERPPQGFFPTAATPIAKINRFNPFYLPAAFLAAFSAALAAFSAIFFFSSSERMRGKTGLGESTL